MSVILFLVTDKFTESMYVLANEPSVALYRLQEHVRRSLPELVQHKVLTLCHSGLHKNSQLIKPKTNSATSFVFFPITTGKYVSRNIFSIPGLFDTNVKTQFV